MVLPGDPSVLSTTVTTGVIASIQGINSSSINNFATRFVAFEEYRIVKAHLKVRCFSSTNPGVGNFWIDDTGSIAAPTAIEAQQRQGVERFSFSDVNPNVFQLTYTPRSPTEQIWNPIATPQSIATWKIYTDNANFGSSIVVTPYILVQGYFTVQFRGVV
jgi:hypothetical protein